MTDFEIALLRLVDRGGGKWSWYEIGKRLPGPLLHEAPEMYRTLEKLANQGFIIRHPDNPLDKWELTDKGSDLLKSL